MPYGVPRKANFRARTDRQAPCSPIEDWHEPLVGERDGYRIIEKEAGNGMFHPISPREIASRLADLPDWTIAELDVVQLSDVTRKKRRFPCYGLQWGTAIYLYPMCETMVEIYCAPPGPKLLNETKMYGGKWFEDNGEKTWMLQWSEKTLRDFYLNNVLIHELGHLNDDRNSSFDSRERYADWFAIEFGYRKTRNRKNSNRNPGSRHSNHRRRHHGGK